METLLIDGRVKQQYNVTKDINGAVPSYKQGTTYFLFNEINKMTIDLSTPYCY